MSNTPFTYRLLLACTLCVLFFAIGCGPALTPEDLGTVSLEPPKVANDEPYPLPKLGDSREDEHSSQEHHDHPH